MRRLFFRPRTAVAISALLVVLLFTFVIPQLIVHAATITVTTAAYPGTPDDNQCSLAEAVAAANANAADPLDCGGLGLFGTDTIVFAGGITNINISTSLLGTDPNDKISGGNLVRFTVTTAGITIDGLVLENFGGPGILVNAVANVTISDNIIYDVAGAGIQVLAGSTNTTILNNTIGYARTTFLMTATCSDSPTLLTSISGTGILVDDADGTTINGNTVVCSSIGIAVTNADDVQIINNNVGTDAGGITTSVGNTTEGIIATGVTNITISNNRVRRNRDGISLTNVTCTVACVVSNNIIGSVTLGTTGNRRNGIVLNNSDDVLLQDNTIRNNAGHGISVLGGSAGVTIQGGVIRNNGGDGLSVTSGVQIFVDSATDPVSIFNNGGLGIDLDNNGVSIAVPGSNGGQEFPDLNSPAYSDGANTTGLINNGTLGAGPVTLHFYHNAACDPTGFGEGQTYIESQTVTVFGATTYILGTSFTSGFITVIAVDAAGNTSEFSICARIRPLVAAFTPIPATQSVGVAVNFDNQSTTGAGITYAWDFGDGFVSSAFEPAHIYTTPGTYIVELCVNAPGGLQECTTRTVIITTAPPPPPPPPPPTTPVTPEVTPEITPEITPDVTSEVTPEITPEITPEVTQEITPDVTSEVTPEITPEITPEVTQEITPVVTPEITPEVIPTTPVVPTLIYFARVSAPLRQCVAQNGILLCVEIDPNNPVTGDVTVTTADGTVIVGSAFEPYVIKFARPNQLLPGGLVTYTILVINPTDETIRNVRVTDNMPVAVVILSSTASSGTLNVVGQQVTFSQATLGPNGRITITINGRIRDDRVFEAVDLDNEACVTSSGNVSSQCASFGFSPGTGIDSGETPLPVTILRLLFVGASLIVILALGWRIVRLIRPN